MGVAVKIPSVGESITEVTIGEWTKKDGDHVDQGDVILVLETDKASVEINAENSGVLHTKAKEGDTLEVGATVAEIEEGESKKSDSGSDDADDEKTETKVQSKSSDDSSGDSIPKPKGDPKPVEIPSVGESITEVTISEWNKKDGDYVERDEVLMVLETDKASVEVNAELSGILKIEVQEGETAKVGAKVATIQPADAPKGASESKSSSKSKSSSNGSSNGKSQGGVEIASEQLQELSPAVRHMVLDKGIDPSNIPASGKGGRLTKEDVLSYLDNGESKSGAGKSQSTPSSSGSSKSMKAPSIDEDRQTVKPMSAIRKTIARRLKEVQNTAAILTTFNEVDLTNAIAMRKKYQDEFVKKYDVKLGFMSIFMKAALEGLKDFPAVNAFIEGDNLVYNNFYNIGVAISTKKGLMVPVIRDADKMSLAEIELAIKSMAEKGRNGRISMDDLSGGTFSITNGGVFGSMMSTPILNPPQSAILGMHAMMDRPMAIDGEIKIRKMMYLALSYDHRIIDGAEAVSFLVKLKQCVEDPTRLLIHV